jgi:hypothetical protein
MQHRATLLGDVLIGSVHGPIFALALCSTLFIQPSIGTLQRRGHATPCCDYVVAFVVVALYVVVRVLVCDVVIVGFVRVIDVGLLSYCCWCGMGVHRVAGDF